MNILWLSPMVPGLYSGGAVRTYHLLRHTSRRHRVALVAMRHASAPDDGTEVREWGVDTTLVPFDTIAPVNRWRRRAAAWTQLLADPYPHYARTFPMDAWRAATRRALERFRPDVVHCDMLFAAPLMASAPGTGALLDEHNVEWLNVKRMASVQTARVRRLAQRIEAWKLRRWERRWVERSRAVTAVSEDDARLLRRWATGERIVLVPNGVDCDRFAPPAGTDLKRRGILFFGNLGYPPNADAARYFCREILPLVRREVPDAETIIAGPGAEAGMEALGALPGVRYAGFLPDVREALWRAALCVTPLRSGSGTRLKILEALAAGCAVVSTTIGAEGLDLLNGEEIVVANEPTEIAEAVVRLLRDGVDRARLGRNGQAAVRERFDWTVIAPRLEMAHRWAAGNDT